jgi:hypothetical protein
MVDPGLNSRFGQEYFFLSLGPDRRWISFIHIPNEYSEFSLRVKQQENESPAKIRNTWSFAFNSSYFFMVWYLRTRATLHFKHKSLHIRAWIKLARSLQLYRFRHFLLSAGEQYLPRKFLAVLQVSQRKDAIAVLHTFQFTVTHALGFLVSLVVSWQRVYHSLPVTWNHTWSLRVTA